MSASFQSQTPESQSIRRASPLDSRCLPAAPPHRRPDVPIPDCLDEVGNGGGGPDAPRKAVGNDVFAAAFGWLRLHLRKPDRLSGYHEKSSMLQQEPEKPPNPSATPHSALNAHLLNSHLKAVRGFSWSPLLRLKHFARGSVASSKKPLRACACSSAG